MRIAFVTESWHPSTDGIVTRLTATTRELRRRGHEVLVISPNDVPTVGFRFLYGGRRWGLPVPRVVRYLRDFGPDVVHVVNPMLLGMAGVWGARRLGVPLVASYHTDVGRYASFYRLGRLEPLIRRVVAALHRKAVVNLATSAERCTELAGLGAPGVRLWRRGVDLELFHPARRRVSESRERVRALYVGRLGREKSIDDLTALVEPCDVELTLVGDGPDRERLARRFEGRPVRFAGTLHGLPLAEAYAAADVFVFPSTTETLGLVLLEALASGLPVVAADTPASREITANCTACVLYGPEQVDKLAVLVDELLDTAPRSQLAAAARAEAERWSWEAATDDLLAHYADAGAWSGDGASDRPTFADAS